MLPVIMVDAEVRIQATELLEQETDKEIRKLLEEMMVDDSLEGTEAQKNAYLAPAEKVEMDEGSMAIPPTPVELQPKEEKKSKDTSRIPDPIRRPSQDEIFYGDEFDEGNDGLI
jgi:hypothetical protein